jgi:murein DD-endopeptidase MepM/ murein hydrolase activator NlpD
LHGRSLLLGALGGALLTAVGFAYGPAVVAGTQPLLNGTMELFGGDGPETSSEPTTALGNLTVPEPVEAYDPDALALVMVSPEPPPPPATARTVAVERGDTLMDLMVRAGAERRDAHEAISALAQHYDPRRLRPGQEITLVFRAAQADGPELLDKVDLAADVDRRVEVRRGIEGFVAAEIEQPLDAVAQRAVGHIEDSLYLAARRAEVPDPVLVELIRLYSFDVDFQRDIQPGDGFEVFYEGFADEHAQVVKHGPVLFARLDVGGKSLPLYRFETDDGTVDYYSEQGESVRKALMKTPVDGARLSSRFGMRKHPILGYTKMHRGLDFAAPSGTPIMAAGDGVIDFAGRHGGYGKYVRLRHNSEYETAYAHMSKFARGIKRGKRVQQGEIIGYVGTTGRSTGPHLHYEVLHNEQQINPLGLKLPTGRKLEGAELARFRKAREALDRRIRQVPVATQVARSED